MSEPISISGKTSGGISRRQCLQGMVVGLATVGLGASLVACKKGSVDLSCNDTSGLAPMDLQLRNTLGYVDKSVEPDKTCSNCVQFNTGGDTACGTCKVVKGPINPGGYCKSWGAKT